MRLSDLQTIKFSFSVVYLPFSLISIILFWYLKDKLKIKDKNPIVYIGKNAIWFYFAQGISSSLLYYIYPYISNHRDIVVFPIMLIINIALATIMAIILEKSYNIIDKIEKNDKILKVVKSLAPQKIK